MHGRISATNKPKRSRSGASTAGRSPGADDGRPGRENMNREDRHVLESIVFAYFVGEMELEPITARRKVDSMTDEELKKFVE